MISYTRLALRPTFGLAYGATVATVWATFLVEACLLGLLAHSVNA